MGIQDFYLEINVTCLYLDVLTAKCQRKKVIKIADKMSIKTRTADLYLAKFSKKNTSKK